jgi:diguanylate cyclase (GGDEF)-like protein
MPVPIDIASFYLTGALVSALLAAAISAGGGLASRHNGLASVVWAALALAAGLLALGLGGRGGSAWAEGLGISLVALGALLFRFALDQLRGQPERARVPLFVFGAALLAEWGGIVGGTPVEVRAAVGALGTAVVFLLPVPTLFRMQEPGSGHAHQLTLAMFVSAAAVSFTRGVAVAAGVAPPELTSASPVNVLLALALLGAVAAGAFSFLIMLRQRDVATLAMLDGLTGILNRPTLHDQVERVLGLARRRGFACSVLLADLDRFSQINVEQGHRGGDEVLRHFVTLARGVVRREDVLGRYGGEQFAMLLFATPAAGALALARRLRTALASKPPRIRGLGIALTASYGVAESRPGAELEATELLRRADAALVEAKARGRDCVVCFDELASPPPAA